MRELAAGIIVVLLGVYFVDNYLHARHAPGVLVPSDPYQGPITGGVPWKVNGNQFTPLADFHLRARVLHTDRIQFQVSDRDLCTTDAGRERRSALGHAGQDQDARSGHPEF